MKAEARLLAILAKKKGKGKATSSASKNCTVAGHDLFGLPSTTIVLGSTLRGVPLETDTGVPLEPIKSLRCQSRKSLRLVEEVEEGKSDEAAPSRP